MAGVFISYRREDSEGHAGHIFEDLCRHLGEARVFMDVAGIGPGVDFRKEIELAVMGCDVLLAIVGRSWLSAVDARGQKRLNDPKDFVRMEMAAALRRGIPVIPVLVQDAAMPTAGDLPEELREFAFRNAVELRHKRWDDDIASLVGVLQRLTSTAPGKHVTNGNATASSAEPMPVQKSVPSSAGGKRFVWAAVTAAIVAVAGAVVALRPTAPPADATGSTPPVTRPATDKEQPGTKAESPDFAGKWRTQVLVNPYDKKERSTLLLEFTEQGDALLGMVTEMNADGSHDFTRGIGNGKIKGNVISFDTQGETTWDGGTRPYKESYVGTLNKTKDEIAFTRLNDVPSGGVPETFVAKRN